MHEDRLQATEPDRPAGTRPVIGYTAGVYDLFHVGHLNLLERARAACDRLVVGVTSDALAKARKGRPPFVPYDERCAIVAALRCVDTVVMQSDMDKFAAWQRLGFHRLFVGSDWQGNPAWNDLEVRLAGVGVTVIYFPYTAHVSTSRLRATLENLPPHPETAPTGTPVSGR